MKEKQKDNWYGVYDCFKKQLVYIYKDEISAINQIRRGATNWKLVLVECNYDITQIAEINCKCCCNCS